MNKTAGHVLSQASYSMICKLGFTTYLQYIYYLW